MYEKIGQTSEPDAKKQTFCHTGSRQTLFFFFLIIATCWGPPLLGFVEAVVPGDADVVLEGSGSDSSGSISDPEAEVAPAVRCPPLRNCLERYNDQGNWTGI